MSTALRKTTSILALTLFVTTSILPAFGQAQQTEEAALKLLAEGESFFTNFQYEEALEKYREAFRSLKTKGGLMRFYLDMSQAYFALGDEANVKIMLRKLLELDNTVEIDKKNYPKGLIKIFMDTRIEHSIPGSAPGALGQEGIKKKKRTPWLLIIGGTAVAAILVYFLWIKKSGTPATPEKFTLTVTKGTGVLGSPNSGTYSYEKGSIASYNYSLEIDYLFYDLVVKVNGVDVPPTGNITMDGNYTLSAATVGFWKK